jgi:hypothetical protein
MRKPGCHIERHIRTKGRSQWGKLGMYTAIYRPMHLWIIDCTWTTDKIYSPLFNYAQNREYMRYRELVYFSWKNNSSGSIYLNVSTICGSRGVQTALEFAPCVPSRSPTRRKSRWVLSEERGGKRFVHPAQPICLEKFYSGTLSL